MVVFGLCIFLWLFLGLLHFIPLPLFKLQYCVGVLCLFPLLLLILTSGDSGVSPTASTAVKRRCLSIAVTYIPWLYGSQDANQQAWENSHTHTHAHTPTSLAILLRWLRLTLSLLISSLNSFHLYIFFLHPSLLPPPLASS